MKDAQRLIVIAGVIAGIAIFGSGYYVGANVAPRSATTATATTGTTAGGPGGAAGLRGGAGGGGNVAANVPLNGRILSVNADSITVAVTQRQGGAGPGASASPVVSSSIALVGANTRVIKTTETDVKLSELKAGDMVTIVGQSDATTGTIIAQTVVVGGAGIGQLFGGGGGPGGGAPRPSASPIR